jgi:membrane carboxypeptidase/penicillin-binding protein
MPLSTFGARTRARINLHDVVYVKVTESTVKQTTIRTVNGKQQREVQETGGRAELRVRPTVQGVAVVLENKTGRVLAMAGSFSYPLSQFDRVTQGRRQPGSSFKPMTYLAALNSGLQPNTLVEDAPVTYPPIGGTTRFTKDTDYWSPRNYDQGYSGTMTLRRALEQSKNLVTARLLDGGIANDPPESLDTICKIAVEAGVYPKCERYYPFVLGAQPVRPIDLAAFYATVANEGKRPTPHVIEQITQDGRVVYKADEALKTLTSVDPAAVFQLRTILQGVVTRGTGARLSAMSPYIAGKTGTSDDFNDSWFAGFSNDVTVVVWVGYDNAKTKRTLGSGQAGSRVAIPIFEPIMKAVWAHVAPQTPLVGPTPPTARNLVALPVDPHSGQRLDGGYRGGYARGEYRTEYRSSGGTVMEYFRLDSGGRIADTQDRMLSRGGGFYSDFERPFNGFQSWFGRTFTGPPEPGYIRGFPQGGGFSQGGGGGQITIQRDFEGRPIYQQRDYGPPPPPPSGGWRGRGGY